MSKSREMVEYDGKKRRETEIEDTEDEEDNLADKVMDILNLKVVPRKPGDPGFKQTRLPPLPTEAMIYATEYCRLYDGANKLRTELRSKELGEEEPKSSTPVPDELERVREDNDELERDVNLAEAALLEEKRKVADLQKALARHQKLLEESERKNQEKGKVLETLSKQLKEKEHQLEDKTCKIASDSSVKLEKEKQDWEGKLKEKTLKVTRLEESNAKLIKEKDDLEAKMKDEMTKLTRVEEYNAKLVKEKLDIGAKMMDKTVKTARLDESNAKLVKEKQDLEIKMMEKALKVTRLEDSNAKLVKENLDLEAKMKDKMLTLTRVEDYNAKLVKEKQDLEEKMKEKTLAAKRLQDSNTKLVKDKQDLETNLMELTTKYEGELKMAQSSVLEERSEIEKLTSLVTSLQQEMANSIQVRIEIEAQVKTAQQDVSDLRVQLSTLQVQLERQVTKSSQYRSDLLKAQDKVNTQETQLKDAEGIIVDQQKVVDEAQHQKKRLEKILQINLKLDEKVLNLEGGIRERQQEIERLERGLTNEQRENSRWQANCRQLRDDVFNLTQELTVFLGNVPQETVSTVSVQPNDEDSESDDIVQRKLMWLGNLVKRKFSTMDEMQKETLQDLANTKNGMMALSQIVDSFLASSSSAPLENPQQLELTTTTTSFTTVIIGSTTTTTTSGNIDSNSSNYGVNDPCTSYLPCNPPSSTADPTEGPWLPQPAVATVEDVAPQWCLQAGVTRHGRNTAKLDRGYFCLCSDRKFCSKRTLTAHLKYVMAKWKLKCVVCTLRFRSIAALKRHLRITHHVIIKLRMNFCRECGRGFDSPEKLSRHKRIVHAVKMSAKKVLQKRTNKSDGAPNSSLYPVIGISQSETDNHIPQTQAANFNSPTTGIDFGMLHKTCLSFPVETNNVFPRTGPRVPSKHSSAESTSTQQQEMPPGESMNVQDAELIPLTQIKVEVLSPVPEDNEPPVRKHGVNWSKKISRSRRGQVCTCGHKAATPKALRSHISYHNDEPKFKCLNCHRAFTQMAYLRRHRLSAHSITDTRKGCPACGRAFKTTEELKQHRKETKQCQVKRKPRTIDQVDLTFQEDPPGEIPGNLTLVRSDGQEKLRFHCTTELSSSQVLDKHTTDLSSGDKKFECNICGERFRFVQQLQQHLVSEHNVKFSQLRKNLFGCPDCGEIFNSKNILTQHRNLTHSFKKSVPEVVSPPEVLEEPSSSEITVELSQTRNISEELSPSVNILVSPPEKDVSPTPAIAFAQIKTEPITETGTTRGKHGVDRTKKARRGYICWCGHSASNENNLHRHISDQNIEPHFECSVCSRRFLYTSYLRKHMKTTHNMDYTLKGCRRCGASFATGKELHAHQVLLKHRRERKVITQVDLTSAPAQSPPTPKNAFRSSRVTTSLSSRMSVRGSTTGGIVVVTPSLSSSPACVTTSKATTSSIKLRGSHLGHKQHGVDQSKRHLGHFCLCGVKSSGAMNLSSHILYFTSERKFKCKLCSQRFILSSRLKAHMTSKHNISVPQHRQDVGFVCAECGKWGFPTKAQLKTHQRLVHPLTSVSETTSRDRTPTPPEGRPTVIRGPSIIISTGGARSSPPVTVCGSSNEPPLPLSEHQTTAGGGCHDSKSPWGAHPSNEMGGKQINGKQINCKFCPERCVSISQLKEHMKDAHDLNLDKEELIGCRDCGDVFSSKNEFKLHRLTRHPQPSYQKSPLNLALKNPQSESTGEPSNPSNFGNLQALPNPTTSNLPSSAGASWRQSVPPSLPNAGENGNDEDMIVDAHLTEEPYPEATEHGIDLRRPGFVCFCGLDCSSLFNLNRHINYYSVHRRFVCKTCGNGFLSPSHLRLHMLRVHKIVYNISNGCKTCGEAFPTNMQLYHHFRNAHNHNSSLELREVKYNPPGTTTTPTETPSSSTSICTVERDATSSTDHQSRVETKSEEHATMSEDLRSPNGTPNFICKCGKIYRTFNGLRYHVRMKSIGKIFQCHLCPSSFYTYRALKSHGVKVHKVPYDRGCFACVLCAATFGTIKERNVHQRTTHIKESGKGKKLN